jgi:hypothetical protein
MVLKYSNIVHYKTLHTYKIYPNWDFWFENMPSGNPDDYPLQKRDCSFESALWSPERETEPEVGQLVLQKNPEPLLDLRERLLLLLGDGTHAVGSEQKSCVKPTEWISVARRLRAAP